MRSLTQLIASTMFLAFSPALFAADYRFTHIDVPGSISTQARGINARGDIVGSYEDSEGVSHGFLLRNGAFSVVDFPGAAVTLGARAINARATSSVIFWMPARSPMDTCCGTDSSRRSTSLAPPSRLPTESTTPATSWAGTSTRRATRMWYLLKDGLFQSVHVPSSSATAVSSAQDSGRVFVGQVQMPPDGAFFGFVRNASGRIQLITFPGLTVPCGFCGD